jgi:hypothetical protein
MVRLAGTIALVVLLAGGAAQGARTSAPANTSPPSVSGQEQAGETLNAASGAWSGSTPMTFAYRWQRCDKNGNSCGTISGATNQSYVVQRNDVGRRLRVSVTASNSDGSANAVSSPTGVIANGAVPDDTVGPVVSGTTKVGSVLSTTNGSWTHSPTSFSYEWDRCDTSGSACRPVGSNRTTYRLQSADAGSTIRVTVTAKNAYGAARSTSSPTGVVAPAGAAPTSTAAPQIGGVPRDGQTLVASTGNWSNSPTRYDYQWLRCDTNGSNCSGFGGGNSSQKLSSSEVGHTVRVTVSARNQFGTNKATSAQTAVVVSSSTPSSIAASQVALPNLLVISALQFVPSQLSSRQSFVGRFRVSDSHGNLVRGALVYGIGLPYGWIRNAPEVVTGSDGWATIQFFPTRLMPLHRASVVFFVRARKPGDNPLVGVTARRLVQVHIR